MLMPKGLRVHTEPHPTGVLTGATDLGLSFSKQHLLLSVMHERCGHH